MKRRERISAAEARRLALAAQGFGKARPEPADAARLKRLTRRLGLLQIDSVNILVRAHYMPGFSRLGLYSPDLLDQAAYGGRRRHLFEYWGHAASLLPVELYPLLRWRMAAAERAIEIADAAEPDRAERAAYRARLLAEIRARGALAASDLEQAGPRAGPWWGWSDGKRALEQLFWTGHLTTATRRNFERIYDLPERVLPASALDAAVPEQADAQRALLLISAKALGIATEADLRDYFRLKNPDCRQRLTELVEAGELLPVTVEGWKEPAYLDPQAKLPRRIEARTLLSPFDPLIWERDRTERLWGLRYRIEIYTPEPKRQYGYYVLPVLQDEKLVGRVDLKADRAAGILRVLASHAEPGIEAERAAPALLDALRQMAAWLGLDRIDVAPRGDLAETLRRHHGVPTPVEA